MNARQIIYNIFKRIDKKSKNKLITTIFISFISAIAEVYSIQKIYPLLNQIMGDFVQTTESKIAFDLSDEFLKTTFFFAIFVTFAGFSRVISLFHIKRTSALIGNQLAYQLQRNLIYKELIWHKRKKSTDIAATSFHGVSQAIVFIESILIGISGLILLFSIIFTILSVDFFAAVTCISLVFIPYLIVIKLTKKSLNRISQRVNLRSKNVLEELNIIFNGIREIILNNSYEMRLSNYSAEDKKLRVVFANGQFLSGMPRYLLEPIGILAIISTIILLKITSLGFSSILPKIGLLVFGAQKLVPIFQQIYSSWAAFQASIFSTSEILLMTGDESELFLRNQDNRLLNWKNIEIKNINFSYGAKNEFGLKANNISFTKGSRIALVGKTGSGKSTFIDIISGLMAPSNGKILIDGKDLYSNKELRDEWIEMTSYLSQNIFLFNDSIFSNIVLGSSHFDKDKVILAAIKSGLIKNRSKSSLKFLKKSVGENGIFVSGGEKQRISIARAFYHGAKLLIMDEPTSALDQETEEFVIKNIFESETFETIFVVTHRPNPLKYCQKTLFFENGNILLKK